MKKILVVFMAVFVLALSVMASFGGAESKDSDYIKYVEFNVTYEALSKALTIDIDSRQEDTAINWVDLLAYLGAKYGGDFKSYKARHMDELADKLRQGEKLEDLVKDMKHFDYYREAYGAVLDGFLGTYTQYIANENGSVTTEETYGLQVYSPIAKTFPFSHYDDFGSSRSYGYKRRHLGHDLMAATGTPIIAIETGVVECMGWNQYGGWRIGIRSLDTKRYYYYAHLRQNRPYHCDLKEGDTVYAGDVIGYVGRTGYSTTENANNINVSHLHLGLQLVFDESQKECDNEIWIDLYAITRLLQSHQSSVYRVAETKEFYGARQQQFLSTPDEVPPDS